MKFQITKKKVYNYALAIGLGSAVYLSLKTPVAAINLSDLNDFNKFVAFNMCHNYGKVSTKKLISESTLQALNESGSGRALEIKEQIAKLNKEARADYGTLLIHNMLRYCRNEATLFIRDIEANNFFQD